MFILKRKRSRLVFLLVLAVILAAATYGFAAANTVPDVVAGDGTGDVSGYEITNLIINLDDTDPSKVHDIQFEVNSVPSYMVVTVGTDDGTTFTDTYTLGSECSFSGSVATCTPGTMPSVVNVEFVRVIAKDHSDPAD
jgi:opacity protein-like surface antigen